MKLTPFYPHTIQPVRSGVYKVKGYWSGEGYAYWNNKKKRWSWTAPNIESVSKGRMYGAAQDKYWCGLAKEPK